MQRERPNPMVCAVLSAGALALLLTRSQAHAQASDQLADATVRARVANIQGILDERSGRVQLWQYTFMALGYSVSAGFVALAATTADKEQRLDFAFAAGGAFIDTTVHVLGSIQVRAAAQLREQPDGTPAEARIKLSMAEAQLAAAAEAERDRRSLLKAQILPVGFSLATGLVLAVGFGHIRGAIINTVAAIVINEVRVLTQPTSTIAALDEYRQNPDAARVQRGGSWNLALGPTGCGIQGTF